MAVRTKRLAADSHPSGTGIETVYTCPPGETTILKHIVLYSEAGASRVVVGADSGSGGVSPSLVDTAMTATQALRFDVWVVLMPGDELFLYSESGTFTAWLSGTELEGTAD